MQSPKRRWQTIGMVENLTLVVVHTWPTVEPEGTDEVGRIISARKATAHERRAYEEGIREGWATDRQAEGGTQGSLKRCLRTKSTRATFQRCATGRMLAAACSIGP